jgi:hypothetical protein
MEYVTQRTTMTRTVLLLGRTAIVVDDARQRVGIPDLHLLVGTGIEDVRSALSEGSVDHVITGAGIDLETRLEIVREIFLASETTTVHMKDHRSGPEAFLPFVRSVLVGPTNYKA